MLKIKYLNLLPLVLQVILKQIGDCSIRRCDPADLIPVMEINMKTLPEHYSDYFYESLLSELPEAFLVEEAINGVQIKKCDELYLEVRCSNTEGVRLYEKLGFIIKQRLKTYYRDGEDAFLMATEFQY